MRQQIIIDCDPGQDDAINLLLAMVHPTVFDVLGITTVAGNVPLSLTQRNARLMCDLAGRHDIPVFAGCDKPMHRPLTTAEHVHGDTGIDGMDVTEPSSPLASRHAVQFITETLMSAEDESITLVPTGPLTNIGQVLTQAPELTQKIRSIVLMGGAFREGGNYTPSAEFNILVDPEAAATVFSCGRPIVAMGLDVTHQVIATEARVAAIREVGTKPAIATAGMLSFFNRYDAQKYGSDGAPLHDPCTIAYLLCPELFEGQLCNVSVETESLLTLGHTAVDFWHVTEKPKNALWIHGVDADGFYALLTDSLGRYETG